MDLVRVWSLILPSERWNIIRHGVGSLEYKMDQT